MPSSLTILPHNLTQMQCSARIGTVFRDTSIHTDERMFSESRFNVLVNSPAVMKYSLFLPCSYSGLFSFN